MRLVYSSPNKNPFDLLPIEEGRIRFSPSHGRVKHKKSSSKTKIAIQKEEPVAFSFREKAWGVSLAVCAAFSGLAVYSSFQSGYSPFSASSSASFSYARLPNWSIDCRTPPPLPQHPHPLIPERVQEWLKHHDESCRPLLANLIEKANYVDFDAFENQLKASCEAFNQALSALPADRRSYVIPTVKNKSNLWVLRLALKYLKHLPEDVIPLNQLNAYLKNNPAVSNLAFFDDASYSGSQLNNYLNADIKPALQGQIPLSQVFFIVPFMTKNAKKRLLKDGANQIWLAPHQVMKTIGEQFSNQALLEDINRIYFQKDAIHKKLFPEEAASFQGVHSRTTTWFPFKRADHLSTFAQVLDGHIYDCEEGRPIGRAEKPLIDPIIPPYRDRSLLKV